MRILIAVLAISLASCSTQKGNERHAQHARDQIEMVAIQRESRVQEAQAEASANAALVQALAEISRNSPESANAAVVALAVIGVRGQGGDDADAPVVTLQQQRNEALEWAKVISPVAGGLVNTLGVAAINASVTKKQAEITRDIQINDANSDVAIVEAVASLGTAAANSVGVEVGGDYYAVQDSGVISQDTNTSESHSTTSTNQSTTTSDSYNTTSETETNTTSTAETNTSNTTDSYNTTSTSQSASTTTETTSVSLSTSLSYQGQSMTLADLIAQLQSVGATYSIDLDGDGTADITGDGTGDEDLEVDCTIPDFSPPLPQCVGV